jgi:hypothetical protein
MLFTFRVCAVRGPGARRGLAPLNNGPVVVAMQLPASPAARHAARS